MHSHSTIVGRTMLRHLNRQHPAYLNDVTGSPKPDHLNAF